MTGDHDQQQRTLYVGNLSPTVNEDLLMTLFGQIGECRNCKIIHEPGNDPYAFVEFSEHNAALAALAAMNKRSIYGKEMKVNWATTSGHQGGKVDSTRNKEHFHIFVGDLAPEVDQQSLKDAFAAFGEISDVKIMKDAQTLSHKGYGFISFVNKVDAESAITSMNGQWLGTRKIRTNWATRKVQPGDSLGGFGGGGGLQMNNMLNSSHQSSYNNHSSQKFTPKLDYSEVWSRTSENNSTVYVGGISGITEDLVRSAFSQFGQILAVHPFADRGYAFVRFATKEQACTAICSAHGMEVNGCTAKCSWGKENIDVLGGGGGIGANPLNMASSVQNALAASSAAYNALNQQAAAVNSLQQQQQQQQQAAAVTNNNPWTSVGAVNPQTWTTAANAAASYQWAGYPPNAAAMNYWPAQQYQGYQNAPMMQQGWGVMPTATAATSQYQMGGQNPQGYNSKS